MRVKVTDIKAGDQFGDFHVAGWTALEDATRLENGNVSLKVRHEPDGGIDYREWDDTEHKLIVTRKRNG